MELRDEIKDYLSAKKIRNKQRLKTIPERDIITVQLDVLISDFIQSQSTNKDLQFSKEQTPIEFLHSIGIDYYDNTTQVHSVMEQYAQAKVLEALEREVKQAFEIGKSELYHNERGLNVNYATAEQYYETEVKPKYK